MKSNGIRKIFAIYNKHYEYIRDANGNVYKFIFGVNDTKTPYNYLKLVGKVKPKMFPKDFDSKSYDGFSPLVATIYPAGNFYIWEH